MVTNELSDTDILSYYTKFRFEHPKSLWGSTHHLFGKSIERQHELYLARAKKWADSELGKAFIMLNVNNPDNQDVENFDTTLDDNNTMTIFELADLELRK